MRGRVLIVAGSDSGGGAGIQADIKTITALGAFATTAITALTVQNTLGVSDIFDVPARIVAAQMRAVLDDIGTDAVKIGMLHRADIIAAVADALPDGVPLVLDPVMIAKGGQALLQAEALAALQTRLLPRATLLTPNLPEAELLLGRPLPDLAARRAGAMALLASGVTAVLLKGGHADQEPAVTDLLATAAGVTDFTSPRLAGTSTHGTGCTLASAIAAGLAQSLPLDAAITRARRYVADAIRTAPGLGRGHGPLNHAVWGGRSALDLG